MPESGFERSAESVASMEYSLRAAGEEILANVGRIATSGYILGGHGRALPSSLTKRSGKLSQALNDEQYRSITFTDNQAHFRMDLGADLSHKYGIHENGGLKPITENMRKYFWARYFNDDGQYPKAMWANLAMNKTKSDLVYPRRSFMQPAFRREMEEAGQIIKNRVDIFLSVELRRIVSNAKNTR